MARKQEELPGTRRDDEPTPQKPIAALDSACGELDKRKGKAIKAGQDVAETRQQIQDLLHKHEIASYRYEDAKGIEREVFREEVVRTRKVKTEASGDDE